MSTAQPAACRVACPRSASSHAPEREQEIGVTRESTVSLRVLQGLVTAVEQAGGPGAELLCAARLRPEQLDAAEGRISRFELYRLCELALDLTGDPAFGLHWAERLGENGFGLLSHLIAHSADLRRGFEALAHFSRLLCDEMSYQLIEIDERVVVRATRMAGESLRMQRFCSEVMAAGFFRLIRGFASHAAPERVSFAYAAPAYHAEYTRVFERPVLFGQPFTGIVFARSLLEARSPHNDADLHDALRALAQRRLLQFTQRAPYALRVREFLVRQGGAHCTDMRAAAHAVGLSVRSLRRRLTAEGKSYNDVANEAFVILAQHLLRDEKRTIQETAFALRFADSSTFHRAFRRWTGTTPSAYRESQRKAD